MANIIYIGSVDEPDFTFEGPQIVDIGLETEVDVVGEELSTDVMELEVSYDDNEGTLRALGWATPVYYYSASDLIGKFYLTKVTRTGREQYKLYTTSAAGILAYETFYGGLYSGVPFHTIAEQIIGTNGLMPYKGYYSKCTREVVGTSAYSNMHGVLMGKYWDQAKTAESGSGWSGGAFWTATMASKMYAKFTLKGFLGTLRTDSTAASATTLRLSLLGCHANSGAAASITANQYGMFMDVSRGSTSAAWPQFGPVYFVYGSTQISLGTPSAETTYEIEVDPVAGTAKINGVTHAIALASGTGSTPCALHVFGGGVHIYSNSTYGLCAWYTENGDCINAEYEYYRITAQDDTVQCDLAAVVDIYTGNLTCIDLASFSFPTSTNTPEHCSVNEADLTPYDGRYGDYPLFDDQSDFQTELLSNIRFAYEIQDLPVYGWIPVCSKREALHQLIFSQSVILLKAGDGGLLFTPLPERVEATLSEDDIYNEGSTEYLENTNVLELTEHAYVYDPEAAAVTVFDNLGSVTSGYYIAPFSSAPVYGNVTPTGLQVIYHNCNACVALGVGTISAVAYKHSESTLRRVIAAYPDGRDVSVTDATLVTIQNSAMILDRMEAYYGGAYKVKIDLVSNTERCGLKYTFTSAFGESLTGFLVKASKKVTSIVRAACELILGYTPPPINAGYHNYVVLTGSGSWTVPEIVQTEIRPRIRVVLIGGGQGGESGYAGATGNVPYEPYKTMYYADPADGGDVGQPGQGGRVLEFEIENPAAAYTYSCGAGGAGGAISNSHNNNNAGSPGGATTFTDGTTTYSSENGAVLPDGYVNPFNGAMFARVFTTTGWGENYIGHGGKGGYGDCYSSGYQGGGVRRYDDTDCTMLIPTTATFTHGASGASVNINLPTGGAGGGGGYGSNGSAGSAGSSTGSGANEVMHCGNGGKGGDATATPPKATTFNPSYYGYGGHGGGGGGGGGSSGFGNNYRIRVISTNPLKYDEYQITRIEGTPGTGGYGGQGGDGGDGCVIIYY